MLCPCPQVNVVNLPSPKYPLVWYVSHIGWESLNGSPSGLEPGTLSVFRTRTGQCLCKSVKRQSVSFRNIPFPLIFSFKKFCGRTFHPCSLQRAAGWLPTVAGTGRAPFCNLCKRSERISLEGWDCLGFLELEPCHSVEHHSIQMNFYYLGFICM